MSWELALVLIVFFGFVFTGMPLFFGMGISAMLYFLLTGTSLYTLAHEMFSGINSFTLMAIPLFVLAGELMNMGKVTDRICRFAEVSLGRFKGGYAHVNVLGSMLFGGCSGSAIADVSGLGAIEIPMMVKAGYERSFSAALTAATAVQGPLIPPSIPIVIYAAAVGTVSVGGMLLGGAVPGVLMGLADMLMILLMARSGRFPAPIKATFREFAVSLFQTLPALFTPLILMGGIIGGFFTPTEAAAIAAAWAMLIGFHALKDAGVRGLASIFKETSRKSAAMLLLAATATAFGWVLAVEGVPEFLGSLLQGISTDPRVVMLIIVALLLIWGIFMDMLPAILLLGPIFAPIAESVGINSIHFGVVMVATLVIGLITPPYGGCLFMTTIVSGVPMEKMVRAIVPFILIDIAVIILMVFFPEIVLFLPRLFGMA